MELKKIREQQHLKQGEVAKALNLTQTGYSHYENGKREPDIETLIKLAQFFHTTIDNLVGNSTPYLIDKSQFTKTQLEIIDKIKMLSEETCKRVDAYVSGLLVAEEEKQKIINYYQRGQK